MRADITSTTLLAALISVSALVVLAPTRDEGHESRSTIELDAGPLASRFERRVHGASMDSGAPTTCTWRSAPALSPEPLRNETAASGRRLTCP
jgi:hypothetical protein